MEEEEEGGGSGLLVRSGREVRVEEVQMRFKRQPDVALALLNTPSTDYYSKCREIAKYLEQFPDAADLKLSFYMVAAESPTYLKPFPNSLVTEDEDGLAALEIVNEQIPSVKVLQIALKLPNFPHSVINLLHWLLYHSPDKRIIPIPNQCFNAIFHRVANGVNYRQPTHIFKFQSSKFSNSECLWQALKSDKQSTFAFYPAPLATMHSLMHIGFHPLLVKGGGVCFNSDLKQCLESLEDGWSWGKSAVGKLLKTVLVVELLEENRLSRPDKALTDGEQHGNFYFVQKLDMARIRYLLLYSEDTPHSHLNTSVLPLPNKEEVKQEQTFKLFYCVLGSVLVAGTLYTMFCRKVSLPQGVSMPIGTSVPMHLSEYK